MSLALDKLQHAAKNVNEKTRELEGLLQFEASIQNSEKCLREVADRLKQRGEEDLEAATGVFEASKNMYLLLQTRANRGGTIQMGRVNTFLPPPPALGLPSLPCATDNTSLLCPKTQGLVLFVRAVALGAEAAGVGLCSAEVLGLLRDTFLKAGGGWCGQGDGQPLRLDSGVGSYGVRLCM